MCEAVSHRHPISVFKTRQKRRQNQQRGDETKRFFSKKIFLFQTSCIPAKRRHTRLEHQSCFIVINPDTFLIFAWISHFPSFITFSATFSQTIFSSFSITITRTFSLSLSLSVSIFSQTRQACFNKA